MSKSNRFDPADGADYGRCRDCDAALVSEDDANEHMNSTLTSNSLGNRESHSVMILNPSRERRVGQAVRWAVADALDSAVAEFEGLLDDASEEEIGDALWMYPDFKDAWEEYLNER